MAEVRGSDLRAARTSAGLSLGTMAALARVSRGHLSRVETNERPVTPSLVTAYQRVCGAVPSAPADSGDTLADVLRRQFLSVVAASVGAATSEPLARLLDGLAAPAVPARVGLVDVAAVEQAADWATAMDLRLGGGLAGDMCTGALRWAAGLLDASASAEVRPRLHTAVAALADRTAWARHDGGRRAEAHQLATFALNTASIGGDDPDLRARIMLNTAMMTFEGNGHAEAMEIIRLALSDDRISVSTRVNLHTTAARHHGELDDREPGVRHLGIAEDNLDAATGSIAVTDDERLAWRLTSTPGYFDIGLGMALLALGVDEQAHARLSAGLAASPPDRARTELHCRTRLATLHLRNGNHREAEEQTRAALATAERVRSVRITDELRAVAGAARAAGRHQLAAEVATAVRPEDR